MRRIGLAVVLAVGLTLAPLAASAQPTGRVYRIGILGDKASDSSESHRWQTFRAGLRERGWNEGVNIRIEYRWVEGNAARLPELAADLVRLKPDLIATYGSLFTGALKAATSSIPIVFIAHADPVETGHVASLARPGGNITGMAVLQTELGPKGSRTTAFCRPCSRSDRRSLASRHSIRRPRAQSAGGASAHAPVTAAAHRSANCRRASLDYA
jgi:ABC transporter substrate binding protein